MQAVSRTYSAEGTKYSHRTIEKDDEKNVCRNAVALMVDDGSNFQLEKPLFSMSDKQGQSGFVGLGIPKCASEHAVIV